MWIRRRHLLFDRIKSCFWALIKIVDKLDEVINNLNETYDTSFCRIESQITRIDGQSGSNRKWLVALSK